ncbi:MAG: vWA domain-containing protein [Myxococcota bacterium]
MSALKSLWFSSLGGALLIAAASATAQPQIREIDPFDEAAPVQAAPQAAPERGIRVLIETPAAGKTVESPTHVAEVRGNAISTGDRPQSFDLMIAIDVSQSTRHASGADVDGDGEIGEDPHIGLYAPGEFPDDVYSTDPEDTILNAEVAAARALLGGLTSGRTRVGLVTFSGAVDLETGRQKSRDQQDAELQVALTEDFSQVHAALDRVLARGPHGATNFAAGIRLATRELANLSGAVSRPVPGAQRVVLFLTDGLPTFPHGQATVEDPGDLEAAVGAARVAQSAGIRINTYAIGTNALARPMGATEVARATLGTFTPVIEPAAIGAALQSVSFANIEDVAIVNLTLREDTPDVRLNPDGSFVGFVPVQEGANRLLVNAVSSDGSEANVELSFNFKLARNQGKMLERDLAELRELNRNLLLHMEAERIKREKRRQRVEKELEIRAVERD